MKDVLEKNLHKKVIVYTITAKKLEDLKDKFDNFLHDNPSIKDNTMIICGNMYTNVKFMSTIKFTTKETNPEELFKINKYYPRILFVTASCIGYGLDVNVIYSVVKGLTTSVIDCVQKMGQCGRYAFSVNDRKDKIDLLQTLDILFTSTNVYTDKLKK